MDPFANVPQPDIPDLNRLDMDGSSLLCQLALEYALPKHGEAPNYGFFGLLLQYHLGGIDYEKNVATFCIPQLPLATDVRDGDVSDDDGDDLENNLSRSSPTPHRTSDSPEDVDFLSDLSVKNRMVTPSVASASPSDRTDISAAEYRLFRSFRVPDFVRLRLYLDASFRRVRSRVDLIVELKKRGINSVITKRLLEKARVQVEEQAVHAFLQDDDLAAVGFIIGAGNVWSYGELARVDVLTAGNRNARRDGTYTPTPSAVSECSESVTPDHRSSPPAPPTTINKIGTSPNFLRSSNPSPPSQTQIRLDTAEWPLVFTDFSLPEQGRWLSDVKERLDELDEWMVESYRTY